MLRFKLKHHHSAFHCCRVLIMGTTLTVVALHSGYYHHASPSVCHFHSDAILVVWCSYQPFLIGTWSCGLSDLPLSLPKSKIRMGTPITFMQTVIVVYPALELTEHHPNPSVSVTIWVLDSKGGMGEAIN